MAKASLKQMEYAQHISKILNVEMPANEDRFVIGAFISKYKDAADIRQKEMNQELYSQIKEQVKIVDMAREMGMTVVKKGSYYSTKEHDSLRIKLDENRYFRNSRGTGGTVIDFVAEFTGKDEKTVIEELSTRVKGEYTPVLHEKNTEKMLKEPVEFKLPDKSTNMRNMYAYLVQARMLDPEIVQELAREKMIYQDVRRNCVFVSYKDGKPVFATTVGTNTFVSYKGDIPGSDYSHTWHINNNSKALYVTEAPIDAISKMSILKAAGQNHKMYDYLAITGTGKFQAVFTHLKNGKYTEVIIGTDNDEKGIECLQNIRKGIAEQFPNVKVVSDLPKLTKDWNDELKYLFGKGYRYDNYISPSDQLKDLLQEEVKEILQGNVEGAEWWKKAIKQWNYPDELQDYVYDYVSSNRETAIKDVAEDNLQSVETIIRNYNKKTKINVMAPKEPMQEYAQIRDSLNEKMHQGQSLTSEERGFNEGIRYALNEAFKVYSTKGDAAYDEYKTQLLKEREMLSPEQAHWGSSRKEGYKQALLSAVSKARDVHHQSVELQKSVMPRKPIIGQGVDI